MGSEASPAAPGRAAAPAVVARLGGWARAVPAMVKRARGVTMERAARRFIVGLLRVRTVPPAWTRRSGGRFPRAGGVLRARYNVGARQRRVRTIRPSPPRPLL